MSELTEMMKGLVREIVEVKQVQLEIRQALNQLVKGQMIKDVYTPKEFAELTDRNPDYIRQMCREGRIACKRTNSGRGNKPEIRIAHSEYMRFLSEGFLKQ